VSGGNDRWKAWVLGVAIFVMGGCGIAYEYTLSKVSSDLLGNSVQQWAVVIAVMLFFMGVGAEIQQRLPDRWLVDTLAGSQILLGILGGFGPLFLIQTFSFFWLGTLRVDLDLWIADRFRDSSGNSFE